MIQQLLNKILNKNSQTNLQPFTGGPRRPPPSAVVQGLRVSIVEVP
jgi:hypothetical protein